MKSLNIRYPATKPCYDQLLLTFRRKVFSASRTSSSTQTDKNTPITNSDPNPFPAHDPTQSLAPTLSSCDERLEELNIGFWTSVPIASDLAAKVISLYLETDHPLLGPFDPTLFMEDLVQCRTKYCSKLLVSTIMYWSCVSGLEGLGCSISLAETTTANVQCSRLYCSVTHTAVL